MQKRLQGKRTRALKFHRIFTVFHFLGFFSDFTGLRGGAANRILPHTSFLFRFTEFYRVLRGVPEKEIWRNISDARQSLLTLFHFFLFAGNQEVHYVVLGRVVFLLFICFY